MKDAEGYEVLRLIEHGRGCYVSSEYVEGTSLIRWLKYHPNFSKEQLFLWIHEMTRQLECIHKCRGKPCYRYVNPYTMIITKNKELYFLDMNSGSNEKIVPIMRRRSVREHFLPPGEGDYQTESMELDIYGLGKTIQYTLSVSEPEPQLTKGEAARLQKIISKSLDRHSGRAYTHVSELRKEIPVYHARRAFRNGGFSTEAGGLCPERDTCRKNRRKRRVFLLLAAAFLSAAAASVTAYRSMAGASSDLNEPENVKASSDLNEPENIKASENLKKPENAKESGNLTDELQLELGFLYFLDKRDYRTGREHFREIQGNEAANGLAKLSGYLAAESISGKEDELLKLLKETEKAVPEKEKERYYRCLIEGYRLLDNVEAAEAVLRLCAVCRKASGEELQRELGGYMAHAYEKVGETQKAFSEYAAMLDWVKEDAAREELYKKLVILKREEGEPGEAGNICRQGIEELRGSKELRLMHIGMMCADEGVERDMCAQTVRKYIEELPEITEEEEFQKLSREYGIVIEGENIWVGR